MLTKFSEGIAEKMKIGRSEAEETHMADRDDFQIEGSCDTQDSEWEE